jgi:phytoene synthase
MQQRTHTWENSLLVLASEARGTSASVSSLPARDVHLLDAAYGYCEDLTAQHSRSFHFASRFLPINKRRAVRALYAFCRVTDDIVDHPDGDVEAKLWEWRKKNLAPSAARDDLVTIAWTDTRSRYHIPVRYAEQLLEGVARDIYQTRYSTFEELATYCYGVASTVGLMAMHIVGFQGPAVPYAIKLGVALQLTNILRDVGEDWHAGRVYLPQVELLAYGLTDDDLAAGQVDDRWRSFLRFQIDRNRQLYAEARPGISYLSPDGRLAIAAASDVYSAILDDIEDHDFDVFRRRAYVTAGKKVRRLIGLWWHAQRNGRHW